MFVAKDLVHSWTEEFNKLQKQKTQLEIQSLILNAMQKGQYDIIVSSEKVDDQLKYWLEKEGYNVSVYIDYDPSLTGLCQPKTLYKISWA